MMKILAAAALAALVASPAVARSSSLHRARAQMEWQASPPAYGYWGGHYGGEARGDSGLPLGDGTANSPGGIIGGGAGAYQ